MIMLALVLRAAFAVAWQARMGDPARFFFGDSQSYWQLARAVASGRPYQYDSPEQRIFRTPGYPLLLAPAFLAGGGAPPPLVGRLLTSLWGTLAVLGVYGLAKRWFPAPVPLGAAAMAAVYPGAVAMSGLVLSEAPFTAAMLAQLTLWHTAWANPSSRRGRWFALASGLLGAAATLIRPSWLLFTPLLAATLAAAGARSRHKRGLAQAGWVLLGLVIGMSPWWIRNWIVVGRFVPTTLTVGASLYDGWNPEATGASNMDFMTKFTAEARESAARQPTETTPLEYRLDRQLRSAAIRWASRHPGAVLRLAGIKVARMWNVWPNEPSLQVGYVCWIVLFSYGTVMSLALVGAWHAWGQRSSAVLFCCLPAVYFTALHVVFVSSIRYRQPVMLPLMVLAAAALCRWCNRKTPSG